LNYVRALTLTNFFSNENILLKG